MIAIVDYGIGNLRSVQKAFEHVGAPVRLISSPAELEGARAIVLPGVGAFGDGMRNLQEAGFVEPLSRAVEAGVPLLGICLGMQLLFEESEEMGIHRGLGLLRGRVRRFAGGLKVPQIGWNQLFWRRPNPLQAGIPDGAYAYFVHSYYVEPADPDDVLAVTEYGISYASIVGRGNLLGVQFHPEKSQAVGLRILRNFVEWVVQDDRVSRH
ncbi:MAG: imidazole glycerol phosphate synthase subunit HisH [Anaerolineae bacterium]|nr:imidazole glycerol phosphate synthase subunit HisH [Anaerolineae bacterium]